MSRNDVHSDVRNPLIAALYLVLLPIWGLLFAVEVASPAPRLLFVLGYGALTVASILQVPVGLGIARQRVDADDLGVRLRGLGGFTVPWSDLATLTVQRRGNSYTVVLALGPGRSVPSPYLVGRTRRRSLQIEADAVRPVEALAAAHGVAVIPVTDA